MAIATPSVPDIDEPLPPPPTSGGGGGGEPGDPWWHSRWRLLTLGAALVFLGFAAGYAFTTVSGVPSADSVDVGFLHDMRVHHDQAVEMAMILLDKDRDAADPETRLVAKEILLGQQLENGLMVQLLRTWGRAEVNPSGTAMAWMDMPVPTERMPGLATPEQLAELRSATGAEADRLFAELMLAHHEGGIHMAEDAAARARTDAVRELASAIAEGQRSELVILRGIVNRLPA